WEHGGTNGGRVAGRSRTPSPLGGGLGRGFRAFVKRSPNYFEHRVGISKNVMVPKTQNAISFTGEPSIAINILLLLLFVVVLSPIDFDKQSLFQAREVDDVRSNRHLPTKFVTA
ncbi:MAG TPA: hypothetical protein VHK01_19035, partial [Lacipirellulaceae bacterium]|nr:hypothetical protein [Lacipirellulaceae bacterium]